MLLPADAVLGAVDGGWEAAQIILNAERGPYAVRRAAVIGRALSAALDEAGRRPLPAVARQQVVRTFTTYRLLELRIGSLVTQLADGIPIGPESGLTKQLMTQAEQEVMALNASLLGMRAVAWDDGSEGAGGSEGSERSGGSERSAGAVVDAYLYSRAASIYGGTGQIQRNIIGERLLGLPREPAPPERYGAKP
jgi:alkylation response protein AidB-like acyl-CoA dehydrogenase